MRENDAILIVGAGPASLTVAYEPSPRCYRPAIVGEIRQPTPPERRHALAISESRRRDYWQLRMPAVKQVMADIFRDTRIVLTAYPFAVAARNLLVPLLARNNAVRIRGLRNIPGLDTPSPPYLTGLRGAT